MTGAMAQDRETGFVRHDPARCARCCMCIMACPYGVLKQDRMGSETIMKCDMCGDRKTGPGCVEKCPMKAIQAAEVPA
jgi:carbon-monoxide dehydrogenase iron sulfur subunit